MTINGDPSSCVARRLTGWDTLLFELRDDDDMAFEDFVVYRDPVPEGAASAVIVESRHRDLKFKRDDEDATTRIRANDDDLHIVADPLRRPLHLRRQLGTARGGPLRAQGDAAGEAPGPAVHERLVHRDAVRPDGQAAGGPTTRLVSPPAAFCRHPQRAGALAVALGGRQRRPSVSARSFPALRHVARTGARVCLPPADSAGDRVRVPPAAADAGRSARPRLRRPPAAAAARRRGAAALSRREQPAHVPRRGHPARAAGRAHRARRQVAAVRRRAAARTRGHPPRTPRVLRRLEPRRSRAAGSRAHRRDPHRRRAALPADAAAGAAPAAHGRRARAARDIPVAPDAQDRLEIEEAAARRRAVARALAGLSDEDRRIVGLRFSRGWRLCEIARAHGIDEKRIYRRFEQRAGHDSGHGGDA